jgi:leucyl-tRNA synthetase
LSEGESPARESIRPHIDPKLVEELKRIEEKWQARWREARLFEADPDPSRPKFFVTFPYPYVNAYPHLGSAFTVLRVDVTARYKRMRGYNVLFAQGWHATGSPIVAAALRLREGDPKVVKALRDMGIPEDEISKFTDPKHWVYFFTRGWRRDLERYGLSIDWRREFFTTKLNPYYSKFIEWQYLKLREKGLVGRGEHPVVWCPKEQKVVGDHDRPDEYAGISPEEAVIIKFKGDDGLVYPALTYRPETVYGVTNIWVHPDAEYLIVEVDGEDWILNEYMARELADQKHAVKVKGKVQGRELLGRMVVNPVTGERVPILPASFVDPSLGTGVVMSVPAHAPFDYVALRDLKEKPEVLKSYGINPELVKGLRPKPLIKVEGYSDVPARDAVEKRGIKSQLEREKLEDATKEIYAKEYHTGMLTEVTGIWARRKVADAKEDIIKWMIGKGVALRVYTLPRPVYCRCGARTHVKIVSDQWFLLYSKPEWKKLAHEAVDSMKFYPEDVREEFHKIIDWYRDWAFTHKGELGTPLPWDPEWVIESLSDSTIYMAYYTIAKYLQHPEVYGIKPEQLKPEVFDYVFLGKGDPRELSRRTGIPVELLEAMRREFTYWYPVDLRISGKDLIPNHLTFFIFHHVAIFPREYWPKGIGVNGWILVGGERMSKSKGNFILLRQALEWWGADATRWAEILAGADPGLDDANFEASVADKAVEDLLGWLKFVKENYGKGRENRLSIDEWFESVLEKTIKEVTEHMEKTEYKTALVKAFYDLQAQYRWYVRRAGSPHREVLKRFIEAVTLMIAPFAPHVAEEAWEAMGKRGFISTAPWPEPDESKIKPDVERAEEIVRSVLEDAREVLKFAKEAKRLRVIIAAEWKYKVVGSVAEKWRGGALLRAAVKEALASLPSEERRRAGRIIPMINKFPEILSRFVDRSLEERALREAAEFLSRELGVEVIVEAEEESSAPKKSQALPAKPALYAE